MAKEHRTRRIGMRPDASLERRLTGESGNRHQLFASYAGRRRDLGISRRGRKITNFRHRHTLAHHTSLKINMLREDGWVRTLLKKE